MSNHFIPLEQAMEMTTTYRNNRESILADEYKEQDILPICETFDRDAFDYLLGQDGCTKIRIYGGMDENLKVKLVIVGVNDHDEDMLPSSSSSLSEEGDGFEIVEEGFRCPPTCPPGSPLNEP